MRQRDSGKHKGGAARVLRIAETGEIGQFHDINLSICRIKNTPDFLMVRFAKCKEKQSSYAQISAGVKAEMPA